MTGVEEDFRFDCGATWLNLLATRGRTFSARPIERLPTPERLSEWLDASELAPDQNPTEPDLEQAWALREILRALALATVSGEPPAAGPASALARFLVGAPDPVHLSTGDRLRRQPPRTPRAALARIGRQAVDHLTGPERHSLAICPEHDCRGVFADPSGRRRWCPSPACASRGRVRALRARRAAATETADR
jgi:predicted RNA-binding Zn ribbon-like protein